MKTSLCIHMYISFLTSCLGSNVLHNLRESAPYIYLQALIILRCNKHLANQTKQPFETRKPVINLALENTNHDCCLVSNKMTARELGLACH